MDFYSSSVDSLDDHFSYCDSDIITIVERLNQERGNNSFDDLPSPHLSNIGSSVIDSLCSGRSFSSDNTLFGSPCLSPQLETLCSGSSGDGMRTPDFESQSTGSGIQFWKLSPETNPQEGTDAQTSEREGSCVQ